MPDDRFWYALMHHAGPAVPAGESVFDQPGIAEHFAFLQRRAAAGQLVAAITDDQAVVSGVLSVVVRPWRVVMNR